MRYILELLQSLLSSSLINSSSLSILCCCSQSEPLELSSFESKSTGTILFKSSFDWGTEIRCFSLRHNQVWFPGTESLSNEIHFEGASVSFLIITQQFFFSLHCPLLFPFWTVRAEVFWVWIYGYDSWGVLIWVRYRRQWAPCNRGALWLRYRRLDHFKLR